MTTRFWDHSVPACRALQTRLDPIRADFLMVMSARDRMKASDAKRLALQKAVLSQWTEQLENQFIKMPKGRRWLLYPSVASVSSNIVCRVACLDFRTW